MNLYTSHDREHVNSAISTGWSSAGRLPFASSFAGASGEGQGGGVEGVPSFSFADLSHSHY